MLIIAVCFVNQEMATSEMSVLQHQNVTLLTLSVGTAHVGVPPDTAFGQGQGHVKPVSIEMTCVISMHEGQGHVYQGQGHV